MGGHRDNPAGVRSRLDTRVPQKTLPREESAEAFIARVPNEARREDAQRLCRLLGEWTGEAAVMWGPSIVGFGSYRYRYGGREGTAASSVSRPVRQTSWCTSWAAFWTAIQSCWSRLGSHKVTPSGAVR